MHTLFYTLVCIEKHMKLSVSHTLIFFVATRHNIKVDSHI